MFVIFNDGIYDDGPLLIVAELTAFSFSIHLRRVLLTELNILRSWLEVEVGREFRPIDLFLHRLDLSALSVTLMLNSLATGIGLFQQIGSNSTDFFCHDHELFRRYLKVVQYLSPVLLLKSFRVELMSNIVYFGVHLISLTLFTFLEVLKAIEGLEICLFINVPPLNPGPLERLYDFGFLLAFLGLLLLMVRQGLILVYL